MILERWSRKRLWARFELRGEMARVAWPEPVLLAGRADNLWRTTCLEAFLSDGQAYWEYNFSPSGQWSTWRFDAYRAGMRAAEEVTSHVDLEIEDGYAEIEILFERPVTPTRVGLSAVIEAKDGTLSYWALAHPSDKPDFHHPDSFVLSLPEPA